jgi:hypothetical protein
MKLINEMNQRQMWNAFAAAVMGRSLRFFLYSATAIAFGAVSLVAQSDSTFVNANWTASMIGTSSPTSTFTSSQDTWKLIASPCCTFVPYGNPPPSRTTVLTYPGSTGGQIHVAHVYLPFVYDPSDPKQGPVATLTYGYDLKEYNPPVNQAVLYQLLILQNNTYYGGPGDFIYGDWQRFSHPNVPCTGFTKIPGAGTGPNNPDCSCTGSKIQLGYLTRDSTAGDQGIPFAVRTSGIDNWSVTINKAPDPSPVPVFTIPAVTCLMDDPSKSMPVIQADGSASLNETDYFWSVEESDALGGRKPLTERSSWFHGNAGKIDLAAFYASLGGQWKCGTYYRVKLAVKNACVSWTEEVKLIYLSCPKAEADHRPDRQMCCTGAPITLGPQAPDPTATYSWSAGSPAGPAVFFSSLANPIVQPTTDTKYTLIVTDAHGCKASDAVTLSCANNGLTVDVSTGVKNGVTDSFGAVDSNWSLVSDPTGPVQKPVYSVKPNTEAFNWAIPTKGENWISPAVNTDGTPPDISPTDNSTTDKSGNLSGPAYVYHFRNVYLDDSFKNLSLHIDESAADNSMNVTINGKQPWSCGYLWGFSVYSFDTISGTDGQGYVHGPCDWLAPFGDKGLTAGWNTINVDVRNGGTYGGSQTKSPSGMVISGEIHASCSSGLPF